MLGLLGALPLGSMSGPSGFGVKNPLDQSGTGGPAVAAGIQEIIRRPEFQGSRWGMRFCSLRSGEDLYAMNTDQLFIAGSSFKIFPAGTAFSTLGDGYRFRTRLHRTGPIVRGVLKGDLVLVAGGDLLLGGRVQRGGRLSLPDPDHTYNAKRLAGDPLGTLRDLARQVRAQGIRRVEGGVLVDASLFRQGLEDVFSDGMKAAVSPMMVNDNVVDVSVRPGARVGTPGLVRLSPDLGYVRITNEVTTIAAGTADARRLTFTGDVTNPDGTHQVRLAGDAVLGGQEQFIAYHVPEPTRFAEIAFTNALQDAGVGVDADRQAATDRDRRAAYAKTRDLLVEHLSPPLSEEVKVMLKVSSNVHTVHFPYLVGAIAGHEARNAKQRGDELQSRLFRQAGLDPNPPGASDVKYTPDFFIGFLRHMARQPYFHAFHRAMPIMGRDGTLAGVQVDSPAAGHVYAKTGTAGTTSPATGKPLLTKALAGYIELPDGSWTAFAAFMEQEAASADLLTVAGQALGEIATVVYNETSPS
ncbi:D-alanyl-D-alanine carboxypeptidase/D-alanyl-D-alanine endopeptidase [Nonomuraea aurantiaca]|uniref:D-alanyl-D-alanine carboxypeptidase/D-alanyl-D-alanine endopeptidase n=1 Tax=Nonomuraea aurantiaca TaxID=2878562 RepID=UPI0027E07E37|nr:D-alanyl-D-alanine carboxypeptidase/D-alanyl-D-alanine-endopeptidase [Nonomuraea aurantiaca]